MTHQWNTYYSPRNGRITIQACSVCGIAKGLISKVYDCSSDSNNINKKGLKGWTTEKPIVEPIVSFQKDFRSSSVKHA